MAFTIRYYRLFEVQLLHEFYLLGGNKLTYFDLPAAQRKEVLKERVLSREYPLAQDIEIVPTPSCKSALDNYRLKFSMTGGVGFIVAASGVLKPAAGGGEVLKPEIAIPADLELNFSIKVKNPLFKNFTALPMKRDFPGSYLFSNAPTSVQGTGYLSLSQPAPGFVLGKTYGPGEVIRLGGILQEAIANTTDGSHWQGIEEDGYVNENDRVLLPKAFVYTPEPGIPAGNFVFTLKKTSGEVLKTLTIASSRPGDGIRVDMQQYKPATYPDPVPTPDGLYDLEIQTPTATEIRRVYLVSGFDANDVGLINIRVGETDASYRVLGADGELITTPTHPVFEIRFRSRRTFWRYQSRLNSKRLATLDDDTASLFFDEDGNAAVKNTLSKQLVTKVPQKLSRVPVNVTDAGGTVLKPLPHPQPTPLRVKTVTLPGEPPGRLFSEVYVATVPNSLKIGN
jgi:hypothetical protein